MSKRKAIRIDHTDYARVLITETLPYETPVIFSSDGLYSQIRNREKLAPLIRELLEVIVLGEGTQKEPKWTVPLRFKIRKDSRDFRRLSLLHPNAQWKFKQLYERYETVILHYCSKSPASIRAPQRVASSFYTKAVWEDLHSFKVGAVSLMTHDELTRHVPSFFAYRGYDRLYKFFESRAFVNLEKRYSHLRTLDVAKCFDSIYTHALSWAVKDKEFTKENVNVSSTFSQAFDAAMQYANHSETNGIVIGPEISRVFAEIIFQRVDVRTIHLLESHSGLVYGRDYDMRRYVDDVFIFAQSEPTAELVYRRYADVLMDFNLHANAAKSLLTERPFSSPKARLTRSASAAVNLFIDKFLDSSGGPSSLTPRYVRSPWKLVRSFIDEIKSLCSTNQAAYDDIASYLIAVLTERVKKLANNEVASGDEVAERDFAAAFLVLLEVQFFLYAVSPTVSASYRLCTSIVLSVRFAGQYLRSSYNTIAQRIYDFTFSHFATSGKDADISVDAFLSLETLNLLLAARELGSDYLLPAEVIERIFERRDRLSYFQVMCCLWYTKDTTRYDALRTKILEIALAMLGDLSELRTSAEQAYLFLDLLSCPYAPATTKRKLIASARKALHLGAASNAEIDAAIQAGAEHHFHVNWSGMDLLNLLQRKELKQVY